MFLHIGADIEIPADIIIMIADTEATDGTDTRQFIQKMKDKGQYDQVVPGREKSLVITSNRCYASPISSVTLQKRLTNLLSIFDRGRVF